MLRTSFAHPRATLHLRRQVFSQRLLMTLALVGLALFGFASAACSHHSQVTTPTVTAATASSAAAIQPTTVVVVRHAEKDTEPAGDPRLTATGLRRAEALAELLVEAKVAALLSSPYERTRQTLGPLAERFRLEVEEFAAKDYGAFHDAALSHPGATVVIAGHSNTVPELIEALGAGPVAPISEADYNNLYIVSGVGTESPSVLRLRWTGQGWASTP